MEETQCFLLCAVFLAEFLGFFSLWNWNLFSSATVICKFFLHEGNAVEQFVRLSL